jgi:hypothetical protein
MREIPINSKHYSSLAFSLIDCLVGIALTTIVISISFPKIKNNQLSILIKKEARLLQQEIQNLNLLAQIQNTDLSLRINSDSYKTFSETQQVLTTRNLPSGVSISTQSPSNKITLYRTGTATPATILLSKNSYQCEIVVSLRGRISVIC